ncbi:MAG: porin [Pseudomonadota bacterium]
MNKKLIALGVAAVLTAPLAAQAGVEVYGQARASIDLMNNNTTVAGDEDSAITLSSNYSRLGFKGDEDLGNGLTALWQIEQDFDIDTGETFTHSRDTFIGLGGGFGTVLAGKLSTPYRAATTALDPFHDTAGDHNAIIGSLNGSGLYSWNDENRASNAIAYMSPNMSGFSASVAYILASAAPGGDDNLPMGSDDSEEDAYSLAGNYSNGPIFVTAGYESWSALGVGGDDASAWKIGGSYTLMEATTLGAIWESLDAGGSNGERDAWSLSAKHKMGDNTLMAAYSMADEAGGVTDSGASQFSIGVSRNLSAATEVYALYSTVANDDFGNYGLDNRSGAVAGEDMSAFSFGINHKFSSK